MRFTIFLLALPLVAQTFNIAAGTSGDPGVGGYSCPSPNCSTPGITALAPPFNYLRASATTIAYDFAVANGNCTVSLLFIENRAAGPNPATDSGIGTRLFTISANGSAPITVDIFAAVGALTPYTLPLAPIVVVNGHLQIQLTAVKGNATLSGMVIACTSAPPMLTGVPCKSMQPGYIALMAILSDGSCLQLGLFDDSGPIPGVPVTALTAAVPSLDGSLPVVLVKLAGQ